MSVFLTSFYSYLQRLRVQLIKDYKWEVVSNLQFLLRNRRKLIWVVADHPAGHSGGFSRGLVPWLKLLTLVTCDRWHAKPETWDMTHDTWYLIHDSRHLKSDICIIIKFVLDSVLLSPHIERFSASGMRDFRRYQLFWVYML